MYNWNCAVTVYPLVCDLAHRDPLARLDQQVNLVQVVPLVFLVHLDLVAHLVDGVNLALVDRAEEMGNRARRVSAVMLYRVLQPVPVGPYNRVLLYCYNNN